MTRRQLISRFHRISGPETRVTVAVAASDARHTGVTGTANTNIDAGLSASGCPAPAHAVYA